MDSHPYSHETSILTLGAPHEEVQGKQTKLHPGFIMGKLKDVLQNFLIGQWTVYFHFLHFFTKIKKMAPA